MTPDWKTIKYRGGIVEFRIPRSWGEEYGEDGGGAFYDPTPDSDTLRLNVITLRSPTGTVTSETPREILLPTAEKQGASIVQLPGGNALVKYAVPSEEDGVALLIHCWELANAVPPSHARLALFSFTTRLSAQESASRDLQWLDQEIRATRFADTLGI